MSIFSDYIKDKPKEERAAFERIISLVRKHVPDAEEGLSYGFPAFKYRGKPFIGFGSNKHGLNIYPFDPWVVRAVKSEFEEFEVGKGVIRFTLEHQVPENLILLIVDLRLDKIK